MTNLSVQITSDKLITGSRGTQLTQLVKLTDGRDLLHVEVCHKSL